MEPVRIVPVVVASAIFLVTYAAILSEKIHRSIVSVIGAAAMVAAGTWLGFYSDSAAFGWIDFNTIALLFGMMILVGIIQSTGLFAYLAVGVARHDAREPDSPRVHARHLHGRPLVDARQRHDDHRRCASHGLDRRARRRESDSAPHERGSALEHRRRRDPRRRSAEHPHRLGSRVLVQRHARSPCADRIHRRDRYAACPPLLLPTRPARERKGSRGGGGARCQGRASFTRVKR